MSMSRGLLTIMATVTHLGVVVLTIGLITYVTDRDVIVEGDAGTLLGPAMVLTSMAVVFFTLARVFGVADRENRATGIRIPALVAAATTFVAMLVVGAGIYTLERGEGVWFVLFAAKYAASPFVVVSALSAGVVVGLAILSTRLPRSL